METKVKKYKALKIIALIIYILFTIFAIYTLIDEFTSNSSVESRNLALGLVFALIILPFGTIIYGVSTLLSLVGLFLNIKKVEGIENVKQRKRNLIYFFIMSALPYLTEGVIILSINLLLK